VNLNNNSYEIYPLAEKFHYLPDYVDFQRWLIRFSTSVAGFICLIHSNIPFFQDANHFSMIENTIFLFFFNNVNKELINNVVHNIQPAYHSVRGQSGNLPILQWQHAEPGINHFMMRRNVE